MSTMTATWSHALSMHIGRPVLAGRGIGIRLLEDHHPFQDGELLFGNTHAAIRKPKVVLVELIAHLRNEENGVRIARIPELHQRPLGPASALEGQLATERVETLDRNLYQAVGPRKAPKFDARTVKVPAIVHIVIGRENLRQSGIGMIVEVNQEACRKLLFVAGKGLGRTVKATIGQHALGRSSHWRGAPFVSWRCGALIASQTTCFF